MLLILSVVLFSQISASKQNNFSEQNQYINQLEESDKKEFLERIVRRIAGDVDLKDAPLEKSKNISNAELEKHTNYVKKLIDEEKEKFEIQNDKKVPLDSKRSLNHSHIDFTLEGERRSKNNEQIDIVDNTEANTEEYVTVSVQTVYDSAKESTLDPIIKSLEKDDIQVKGSRPKARRSAAANSDDSISNTDVVEPSDRDKLENVDKSPVSEGSEDKILTVNSDVENHTSNTLITTTEAGILLNTISNVTHKINETDDLVKLIDLIDEKQTKLNSMVKHSSDQFLKTNNSYIKNIDIKQSDNLHKITNNKETELTTLKIPADTLDNKGINEYSSQLDLIDTKKTQSDALHDTSDLSAKTNNSNFEEKTLKTEIKQSAQLGNIPNNVTDLNINIPPTVKTFADTLDNKSNKESRPINLIDTKEKQLEAHHNILNVKKKIMRTEIKQTKLTTVKKLTDTLVTKSTFELSSHLDVSDRKDKQLKAPKLKESNEKINKSNIKSKEKNMVLNEDIKTLEIAQDVVKALRIGINRDLVKNRNKNIRTKFTTNNLNVYGLYENSEENLHENNNKNKNQPNYVPVYNYQANNAYYNAYNKFGPNQGDKDSALLKDLQISHYSDVSDDNDTEDNIVRGFYKVPHAEKGKDTLDGNKVTIRNSIYPILPSINDKPHKLPQYDYDYIFGKKDIGESGLRNQKQVKYSEVYLKNRIKNIRESIFNYKEIINEDVDKKTGKGKDNKGWLDGNVEYQTKPNIAKSPQQLTQNIDNIDYDYLGEHFGERIGNVELLDILNSKKVLPVAIEKRAKESEVKTYVKKQTSDTEIQYKIEEVYPLLKKLVKIVEFEEDEEIEACIRVMGDMIKTDNEGLEQYDWLESTVNIQSAIEKLTDLTSAALTGQAIHPSDLELLKYTTYLHSFSEVTKNEPLDARSILPKANKKRKIHHFKSLKDRERIWLYRTPDPGIDYDFDYKALQRFLDNLADHLYDLHNAIKHISIVTTLTNQHWFQNIKDLYLRKPSRKQLLELILHLGSTRLFNLIEDSSKKGIEKNFLKYISENQDEVSRLTEAFVFLLKALDGSMDNKLIENY